MVTSSISLTQSRQEAVAVTILVSSMAASLVVTIAIVSSVVMAPCVVTVVVSTVVTLVQVMDTIAWTEEGSKPCWNYIELERNSFSTLLLPWAIVASNKANKGSIQLFMFDVSC